MVSDTPLAGRRPSLACGAASPTYLLHAVLMFNAAFTVVLSNSFVHLKHRQRLGTLFSWDHADRWPSGFWMRRRP